MCDGCHAHGSRGTYMLPMLLMLLALPLLMLLLLPTSAAAAAGGAADASAVLLWLLPLPPAALPLPPLLLQLLQLQLLFLLPRLVWMLLLLLPQLRMASTDNQTNLNLLRFHQKKICTLLHYHLQSSIDYFKLGLIVQIVPLILLKLKHYFFRTQMQLFRSKELKLQCLLEMF